MNCLASLFHPGSQYSRVSRIITSTSSTLTQHLMSANQFPSAMVLSLYSYWMSPLSSSSSSYSEPCLQKRISFCGPSLCRGITLVGLLSVLNFPSSLPLKGVMKKLSELQVTSDSSMSFGNPSYFHFYACFICSFGGRYEIPFSFGCSVALQQQFFRCSQLMNLKASFALKIIRKSFVLCTMWQQLCPKMIVGGRKSLHSSAVFSISVLALRLPSQKLNSQSSISCFVSCGSFCIFELFQFILFTTFAILFNESHLFEWVQFCLAQVLFLLLRFVFSDPNLLVQNLPRNATTQVHPLLPSIDIGQPGEVHFIHDPLHLLQYYLIVGVVEDELPEVAIDNVLLLPRKREHEDMGLVLLHALDRQCSFEVLPVRFDEGVDVEEDGRVVGEEGFVLQVLVIFLLLLFETELQVLFNVILGRTQVSIIELRLDFLLKSLNRVLVELIPHMGLLDAHPIGVDKDTIVEEMVHQVLILHFVLLARLLVMFEVLHEFAMKLGVLELLQELGVEDKVQQSQCAAHMVDDVIAFYLLGVEGVVVNDLVKVFWGYCGPVVVVVEDELVARGPQIGHHAREKQFVHRDVES